MTDLTFDRRSMLKTAGAAAVGLSAIATAAAPRRRYVIVGMGSRSRMYLTAITKNYQDGNELVAIEAGVSDFWRKYVGLEGAVVGIDRFGESAPAGDLFKHFGFTPEHVAEAVRSVFG